MKYVDGCLACSKEEPGSLSPNGIRSRQGLAETWRARVSRMRRRRFKNDQSEIVLERGETQTRRNGGFLVDRVHVSRPSQYGQRQGDERSAAGQDDEDEKDAVRLEAHGLWRLQGHG